MILSGLVNPTYQRIDKKVRYVYYVEARRKLQLEDGEQCDITNQAGRYSLA